MSGDPHTALLPHMLPLPPRIRSTPPTGAATLGKPWMSAARGSREADLGDAVRGGGGGPSAVGWQLQEGEIPTGGGAGSRYRRAAAGAGYGGAKPAAASGGWGAVGAAATRGTC